jgi:hypothetical protein
MMVWERLHKANIRLGSLYATLMRRLFDASRFLMGGKPKFTLLYWNFRVAWRVMEPNLGPGWLSRCSKLASESPKPRFCQATMRGRMAGRNGTANFRNLPNSTLS